MNFNIGSSVCNIAVSLIQKRNELDVELYINEDKELFHTLYIKKDEIEQKSGLIFDWREIPERKGSRIIICKDVDFDNKDSWNSQFEWLVDIMPKIKKVFKEYILKY